MAHERRFRFGVDLHQTLEDRSWMETAREVEDLGYDTLFVPDHFDEGFGPIAALAAAAAVTTTLNVGALVFDCDFRHPAVLARELTTIDQLSGGRLEVGLGAGWKRLDYERSGIPMDAPKVRVDRMIEYTRILRGLFAGEAVSFQGEHFQINDLVAQPAACPGGPSILIGGGGRRVLGYAGAHADIVGVNASVHSGEVDPPRHKMAPRALRPEGRVDTRRRRRSLRRPRAQRLAHVRPSDRRQRGLRRSRSPDV